MIGRLAPDSRQNPGMNKTSDVPVGHASKACDGERLRGRVLMTTLVASPAPFADAFVVNGLLSQMDEDEAVVAAERWTANPADQTHLPTGQRVHFVSTRWTWPQRGQRYIHWLKWALLPRTVYRILRLIKRERCNVVFANFPDAQMLFASYVASRFLKRKFFPFLHNTYRENRRGVAYVFASWLQRRVFDRADAVFVMSEGMKRELEQLYAGVNFQPLVHTFEQKIPEFEPLPPIDRSNRWPMMTVVPPSWMPLARQARTAGGDCAATNRHEPGSSMVMLSSGARVAVFAVRSICPIWRADTKASVRSARTKSSLNAPRT